MLNCTTQFHPLLLPHSISVQKRTLMAFTAGSVHYWRRGGHTQFLLGREGGEAARNKGRSTISKAVINVGSCFSFSPSMREDREKERLLVTVMVREGHRAIVLKPTMKAKVSETESSTPPPTPQKSHGHPYVGQGASLRKENKSSKLKEQRLADCSC